MEKLTQLKLFFAISIAVMLSACATKQQTVCTAAKPNIAKPQLSSGNVKAGQAADTVLPLVVKDLGAVVAYSQTLEAFVETCKPKAKKDKAKK